MIRIPFFYVFSKAIGSKNMIFNRYKLQKPSNKTVIMFSIHRNFWMTLPEPVSCGFPTRSDTNQPVQSQKLAISLNVWIKQEEDLYYPCSENKGADQLCSNCTADLLLCFCIGKNLVFSRR